MDWNKLFNDFADKYYAVPDFTNEEHVYALQNYLIEQGMLIEDVDYAIKTLLGEEIPKPKNAWNEREIHRKDEDERVSEEEGKFQARSKSGKTVYFKSKDTRDAAIKKGTHTKIEKGTEEPDTDSDIDFDDRGMDEPEVEKPEDKQDLLNSDHQSADDSLNMTKTRAREQAKKKGKKDVGLGTPESRAGEAMVHKGLRLLKEKKSIEEIEEEFTKLVNSDDHILNSKEGKKWVASTIAALRKIDEQIGIDNIEDIVWDKDQGRKAIGVNPKLKTSADMFVRTRDGKNIGISLKKDGKVFLNNGGWKTQVKDLLAGLEGTMPPQEHKDLSEAMSFETFKDDRKKHFQDVCNELQPEDIRRMYKKLMSEPQEIRDKEFGSKQYREKYFEALKDAEQLIKDGRDGNLEERGPVPMKALAKLLKMYDKEKYNHLRKIDGGLTRRAFGVLNTSDAAKIGMNKHIIKSMHVLDTLGLNDNLKNGGVDSFMTVYGIKPNGAVLNEENLTTLFGSKFEQLLSEQIKEVRDGTKEPKDIEDWMANQIEIDYESGQILFKHENEDKIPLFYLNGRSKAIGASPTMELGQTPLMALALEIGTFDTSTWTDKQREKLKKELEKAGGK